MHTTEDPVSCGVQFRHNQVVTQYRWPVVDVESVLNSGHLPYFLGVPVLPPPQDKAEDGKRGSSGNPLRDFMLKSRDHPQGPQPRPFREPTNDGHPSHESPVFPSSPFRDWIPFSKVKNIICSHLYLYINNLLLWYPMSYSLTIIFFVVFLIV